MGQGTCLYIISSKGARDLLKKYYNNECTRPIDFFYINKADNYYCIYPPLCYHNAYQSSIDKMGGH